MRNPNKAPSAASLLASGGSKKTPCCSKVGLKRGPWTPEEDDLLSSYINREGEGRWRTLPKEAGLLRCGKSCRLRWMNYLHPSVKRGQIDPDEEDLILRLHRLLGNRWSLIAGRIPGRTDNEIKNYWNTHLIKKLIRQGINPRTHKPFSDQDQPANHKPTTAKVAPSSSKQKRSQTISNPNSASSGLEEEEVNKAVQNGSDHELEEAALNYCNEDIVFSSFLNSLINDDGFSGSHLQQQSSEHELILPNPVSAFGLGWESAITSSTLSTEPKTDDNQNNV